MPNCSRCGKFYNFWSESGLCDSCAGPTREDSNYAVSLIRCSVCAREISNEAESCPQCGHPSRATRRTATGSRCYSCPAPATTRCQSCGALSCAHHLQSIYVAHGKGGAFELRCQNCYSTAQWSNAIGCIVMAVGLIGLLIFMTIQGYWPFHR